MDKKYKVDQPRRLSSWKEIAKAEITRWLTNEEYADKVTAETLSKDDNPPGPFTKFLYHFAFLCETGWGVMIDFNEHRQRIYLTDHYYNWMHQLRDEIQAQEKNEANSTVSEKA